MPLHTTVHDFASVQSMPDAHEFVVVQPIVQFQPGGHTTWLLQLVVAQSITHSWRSSRQLVHCAGHTEPSGALSLGPSICELSPGASMGPPEVTQKPPTQLRPGNGSQSDGAEHSYSLLL